MSILKEVENFYRHGYTNMENKHFANRKLDELVDLAEESLGVVFLPCSLISDLHKDAYGFRPTHYSLWMSKEDFDVEIGNLVDESNRAYQRQQEEQDHAVVAFEVKVEEIINSGAKDRNTAIRWLMDADDVDGDEGFFEYHYNLPYGYLKEAA